VAQGVVDGLEAIQIHEQHGQHGAVAFGQAEQLPEAVFRQNAVGQAGQRIVVGQKGNLLLLPLMGADILKQQYRADIVPVLDQRIGIVAYWQQAMVGTGEQCIVGMGAAPLAQGLVNGTRPIGQGLAVRAVGMHQRQQLLPSKAVSLSWPSSWQAAGLANMQRPS
jgi:hypothetical protein